MCRSHCPISSHFLLLIILSHFVGTMGKLVRAWSTTSPLPNNILQSQKIMTNLCFNDDSIMLGSKDYGNLVREIPSAVLHPSSISDLVDLIKVSNNCSVPFGVSARGCGHSVRGQAMVRGGVVVDMSSLRKNGIGVRVSWDPLLRLYYADVGGEQLWMDVLLAALEHGLAPVSWTDYLYLSVGGTLSNGGISGQAFLHGPQITNVLELDVITGKGDFVTCSHRINSDLFFGVLGGLGQFGIITRARIILHKAPTRAKWVRLLYSDFTTFTNDQEHLISTSSRTNGADYVEGSLITNHSPPNNWRSSFYSPSHLPKITSLLRRKNGLLYSIELVKYYDDQTIDTIDEELEALLEELNFIPGFVFKKDVPFIDFLGRVKSRDNDKSGQLEETHPWLNLFVPKSRILDFNAGVFVDIIARHNLTSGPILFYPFNGIKWDCRMSAVTPDEDVFYTLGLLHSSGVKESGYYDELNNEIIDFCEKAGIEIKQYLPAYESREDWVTHFGPKWKTFQERKKMFDPKMLLSRGQKIFTAASEDELEYEYA